jgi:zinc metalloprotease ZmpB
MPLELTPDVNVRQDANGRVRQLSHPHKQYRPAPVDRLAAGMTSQLTPRALAEQYLRDAAPVFGFASEQTTNFAATTGINPSDAGVELRFKEEKAVGSAVSVAYDQTVFGLPIWDAGVTVRIDRAAMGVTGSHNAGHYDIQPHRPASTAAYLPHLMDLDKIRRVLGLQPSDPELRINGTRALVYRYRSDERFDPQIEAHQNPDESTGLAGTDPVPFPTLPLPSVPASIENEKHYVVTEVLFSYSFPGWGSLNWRAFVEPDTGTVLYLRALVSCASGSVFVTDPISRTGVLHSAATQASVLDAIRETVPLLGLNVPNPAGGPQELRGEYVRLVNLEAPGTAMPSEMPPHNFQYSCSTENFAACNAYHHCDGMFRLIQGMGIDVGTYFNNTDFPVSVDPHVLFRDQFGNPAPVNAAAPGNTAGNGLGKLVFGLARPNSTFGISADVRVVIHEFGHAVLWDHVDSPNFGFAHSPGDSLAAILHDPHSKAPDRFETFPFMNQSAGLSRRHDRDVGQGWGWFGSRWNTQYGGEQVLSTTLFRVYQAAGGDSTDVAEKEFASRYVSYLILKGISFLSFTTRDPDVYVGALTEADATTDLFEGHPGGAFSKLFRWSFEKQGLYQPQGAPPPVTQPGSPPDVDVYIDDGRRGEYMPYLPDFRGRAEIWNRTLADGNSDHQAPAIGVPSFAYIRIRNRGTKPATGVVVRGFQSRTPQAAIWPTDWKPLSQAALAVPNPIPSGGSSVVGPFSWTPQAAGESLLFGVSAVGDPSNLESVTAGPIPNARLVPLDNNTAQRTF